MLLGEDFLAGYQKRPVAWGFPSGPNSLGEITYRRTYSRDGEEWWQTVDRVVEGTYEILQNHCTVNDLPFDLPTAILDAREMYDAIFNFRWTPPGRGLWMMGTEFVRRRGGASCNNCGFTTTQGIHKEFDKPFRFLLDMSMLGVGVGFDTRGAGKVRWAPGTGTPVVNLVPDTREGWVDAVGMTIRWAFGAGPRVIHDLSPVRRAGLPIRGFGGTSSGPEPLRKLLDAIEALALLRAGSLITSRDIVDLMNLCGVCVVAGNVRRCLPKGTLVHTAQGLIRIEDVRPGMLAKTSTGYFPVSEMVQQGTQKVWGIRTQLGEFRCTARHKMAVMTAPGEYHWKLAQDLLPGDRLVFVDWKTDGEITSWPTWSYQHPESSTTCTDITVPELDVDSAWFLGMFHGDGYTYPNFEKNGFNAYVSVACAGDESVIIERCQEQIRRFGVNLCDVLPSENDGAHKVRAQSKQLAWYLAQFKTAHQSIVVPDFILQGTTTIRAAYLAGLLDADGCPTNRPLVLVASVYQDFLRQVQALYASLGIPSRIRQHRPASGTWQALYQLTLVGEDATRSFLEIVFPHCSRAVTLEAGRRSQNDYGFPSQWVKESGLRYGRAWCEDARQMTTATFRRCGGKTQFLVPIEVLEVVPDVDEVETYDISVPGAREFVCQEGLLVHNTAEIGFGDPNDIDFLDLKDYDKFPERAAFGWTSNNSVFATVGMDYGPIAQRIRKNGEPGVAWLENMRAYGRMKGKADFKDIRVLGGNPCLEQSLEDKELCCLVESYPTHHRTLKEYKQSLKYAYLYAKAVTLVPTHWKETNAVMLRNRRIGTSMSGVAQLLESRGEKELIRWCEAGYKVLEHYDRVYSEWLCVRESIKKSSVKPSGTVSLLAGVTPGAHWPTFRFYIRRVRFAANHPDVPAITTAGYKVEPAVHDPGTVVIEFPVKGPQIRTEDEVSMGEKLHLAALLQRHWADNQVSCTVSFHPEREGHLIKDNLRAYERSLKGVSFLPMRPKGAYDQMPYEAITEEQYEERIRDLRPIVWPAPSQHDADDKFCDGASCQVA